MLDSLRQRAIDRLHLELVGGVPQRVVDGVRVSLHVEALDSAFTVASVPVSAGPGRAREVSSEPSA